jgi:tetratricopeptide (TPR) repeat protein
MDYRIMSQSGLYQTSFHLSMYYFYVGRPDSMVVVWKRYVSQYPEDKRAYEHLVKSYWETGERSYDDITETYEQWLRSEPHDTGTRNAFASFCITAGSAASHAGQDSEAVSYYLKSITLNPHKSGAYNNLGIIYTQKKKYEVAISYFRTAISVDSMYARGYKNLASTFVTSGRPDSAVPYFRKAILLDPRYTMAYEQLAVIYEVLGRQNDAVPLYQQAARLGSIPAQQFLKNNRLTW